MSFATELMQFITDSGKNKDFFWEEMNPKYPDEFDDSLNATFPGIQYEFVDHYGGEGQGEDYWTVYKFTKDGETVYLKWQGWYSSYNGSEFESVSEVKPVERVVTFYE